MKIWMLKHNCNNYASAYSIPELTADEIQSFDGRPKAAEWQGLNVKIYDEDKALPIGDLVGFTCPIFSKKAVEVLHPLLDGSAEILDVNLQNRRFYAINVTAVLDVLDRESSKYLTYRDSQRIMVIKDYAFIKSAELMRHNIFKLAEEPVRRPFVSDVFKNTVEKSGLTGFDFKLVWDSTN